MFNNIFLNDKTLFTILNNMKSKPVVQIIYAFASNDQIDFLLYSENVMLNGTRSLKLMKGLRNIVRVSFIYITL